MLISRRRTARPGIDWPYEMELALRAANTRLRWNRRWTISATTLPVPILASALWIALGRFTLAELPNWPPLVFFLGWLVWLQVWLARRPVTIGQSARYLDNTLGLDGRVASFIELHRQASLERAHYDERSVLGRLLSDATEAVKQRRHLLPSPLRVKLPSRTAAAIAIATVALAAAIFTPSHLDAVRMERALLQQAVNRQLQQLNDVRADIVARPDLPRALQARLLAELDTLETQLRAKDLDQAGLLAALADAQEQIADLSTTPVSEFDNLVRAAQIVWMGADDNPNWEVAESEATTDLGRAVDALSFLSSYIPLFTLLERDQASHALDGASFAAGSQHAELSKHLADGAEALRVNDSGRAYTSMLAAREKFREANVQRQTAEAVEQTLATLEQGRQEIAQATSQGTRKAQVGFRRRDLSRAEGGAAGAPTGVQPTASAATPGEAGATAGDGEAQFQSTSPRIGQNAPALGGSNAPRSGSGDPTDSSGSPAQGGQQGGGNQSGTTAEGTGQTGDQARKGAIQGPIVGPVGGGAGAMSQVQNPQGQGAGGSQQPPGTDSVGGDEVYVPAQGSDGTATRRGPQDGQPGSGAGDAAGQTVAQPQTPNGKDEQGRVGAGALTTIRTPYTEVIGEYAERATEALERTYIPADAKQYVRDYFTALGAGDK